MCLKSVKCGFTMMNGKTGWESDNVWITQDKQKQNKPKKMLEKKIRKDMGERGQYMFSNKADCVGDIWCHTHTIHFPINSKYFKINEKYKKMQETVSFRLSRCRSSFFGPSLCKIHFFFDVF